MLYSGNAYVETPYVLETQSTSVKVGSVKVVEFTPVEPSKHQSDSVKYGPYKNIAAYSTVGFWNIFRQNNLEMKVSYSTVHRLLGLAFSIKKSLAISWCLD